MPVQGITAVQGRELLRVAGNKMVQVRVHDKELRTHPGRARLLSICTNDKEAVVQPHGHGHPEVVKLEEISYWVAGNNHFPEGLEIMNSALLASGLSLAAGGIQSVQAPHYVVSDSMKKVWGGRERGWMQIPRNALEYSNHGDAARAVGRLKMTEGNGDARVVNKTEMQKLVGAWYSEKITSPVQAVAAPSPQISHVRETVPPIQQEAELPSQPQIEPKTDWGVFGFDLDEIINDDQDALQKAFLARKQAAQDAVEARKLLEEAMQRVKAANDEIQQRLSKAVKVETTRGVREDKGSTPRGAVRGAIRKVLTDSSRLDQPSIIARVQGLGLSSSIGSIKQAIYTMLQSGLLEKNENGYSLTKKGRD